MIISPIMRKICTIDKKFVISNVYKLSLDSFLMNQNIRHISSTLPKRISMSEYDRLTDRILKKNKIEKIKTDETDVNKEIVKKINNILKPKNGPCIFFINNLPNYTNNQYYNNNIEQTNEVYATTYYLDFDGNPFFRLLKTECNKIFINEFLVENCNSSLSIYKTKNNKTNNLIINGITLKLYSKYDIYRLNWIANYYNKNNNLNEPYNIYHNNYYTDNFESIKYTYFKMNFINKLEVITCDQNNNEQLDYYLFNFKNNKLKKKFEVKSKFFLNYIYSNYKLAIKRKFEFYTNTLIDKIKIIKIDSSGIIVDVYRKDKLNQNIIDKNMKLYFTKNISNINQLYQELYLIMTY